MLFFKKRKRTHPIVIFDFDHTLYSAARLKVAFKEAFLAHGVDALLFNYTKFLSKGEGRDWKPWRQLHILKHAYGFPEESAQKLEKRLRAILKRDHYYKDSIPFLKKLKKRGVPTALVTYGEDEFQHDKIKATGVEKHIGRIVITPHLEKVQEFTHFFEAQPLRGIFVEDNPLALKAVKQVFPEIVTVRMNRGEGRYVDEPTPKEVDYTIRDLKVLEKIIDA